MCVTVYFRNRIIVTLFQQCRFERAQLDIKNIFKNISLCELPLGNGLYMNRFLDHFWNFTEQTFTLFHLAFR